MEYEKIRLLKESEKSTVELVREKGGSQLFVRKKLKGRIGVYQELQSMQHPGLIRIYEVDAAEGFTTVVEEYVEGQTLGNAGLTEKQIVAALQELCSVLEYLHRHGIIHRDIKPSNIIWAKDGHIRLIDYDAARLMKEDADRDTVFLGTRGYAPPEQYGFAQTDERTDIYALGMTMKQLLEEKSEKLRYRRVIEKCTNLNPDKRYRRASSVKNALSGRNYVVAGGCAVLLAACLCMAAVRFLTPPAGETEAAATGLTVLDTPANPHWDGESGIGVWKNVPESGADGEPSYHYRIYWKETPETPDPEKDTWVVEGDMRGSGLIREGEENYEVNMGSNLTQNGYYYFEVCALGDGVRYKNSSYAMSDAFEYTGEDAPYLPAPEGLAWKMFETDTERRYYATWSNLDDYADTDSFNVTLYDKDGNYVMNNIWDKELVVERGQSGISIRGEFLSDLNGAYRFTVQALTSRPNEYKSSLMPDPIPEEYFSPWFYR
ncbi:MAG: serine/threonine-protein kinase [Eubacteriales bacterium]|nr:serine/threonine-protein kinase [Eubacteriales bacterium]